MTASGVSSATTWDDGYVVDVSYIEPITADLCPAWISMALVLNGQPPLPTDRTLVWAELGCGSGMSACMVGAANDDVVVWGCDFNPAHVERAQTLAGKAGLTNCSFDEATFEEAASDDRLGPPTVDVVVVHGVYSWVSSVNQRHIVEFIRQRLRPGGVAYISYEVPTGWASMVPISEAMRLQVESDGRRSDLAFPDAAAAISQLAVGGARYFPLGPRESGQFALLPSADVRYAAHEYLGGHFGPVMFDDVAREMARARCTYVGSLDPVDHLPAFSVPSALADLVSSTGDPVLRQMLRDLVVQTPLRRELYRRGTAPSTIPEQEIWLDGLSIVGLDKPLVDGATVTVPAGEAALAVEFYEPLVAALYDGPLDLPAMRDTLGLDSGDALAAIAILLAGGYAAPVASAQPSLGARDAARRLNRVLIEENMVGGDHQSLIAPVTGSAAASEYVEMLTLGLLWDQRASDAAGLTELVLHQLEVQGRDVREDGELVTAVDDARRIVSGRVENTLDHRRTALAALGIDDLPPG